MATNALIPLQSEVPDVGRAFSNALLNLDTVNRIRNQPRRNKLLDATTRRADAESSTLEDRTRVESFVNDVAQLEGRPKPQQRLAMLERKARLLERDPNADTSNTDVIISALESGDDAGFQEILKRNKDFGVKAGILKEGPETFSEVKDAQGNVVAQRSSKTGRAVTSPLAPDTTSLQKNLIAAGFEPGTPAFEEKLLELTSRPVGTTVNVGTAGFKVPAGFMINPDDPSGQSIVPIPGGKAGALSGEGAKLSEISRGGTEAVNELKTMLDTGSITQETLAAAQAPDLFNYFKSANVQEFETLSNDLADMIGRLRSGGAINADEESRFVKLLPVFGDKDSVMQNKLKRLSAKFKNIESKVSLAPIKGQTTAPSAPQAQNIPEGATATNASGDKIIMRGGQWQPQ